MLRPRLILLLVGVICNHSYRDCIVDCLNLLRNDDFGVEWGEGEGITRSEARSRNVIRAPNVIRPWQRLIRVWSLHGSNEIIKLRRSYRQGPRRVVASRCE